MWVLSIIVVLVGIALLVAAFFRALNNAPGDVNYLYGNGLSPACAYESGCPVLVEIEVVISGDGSSSCRIELVETGTKS